MKKIFGFWAGTKAYREAVRDKERPERKFEIVCTTTWRSVVLKTRNWSSEMGENVEAVHFRAMCPCGKEHFGSSIPTVRM